ncbi:MAG TPA: hypothetical protein P5323_04445 [Candidatus Moranbacteria bacterium]|nr:hypothetical protein [Candidatus Moranbacteria bacterium]HRY28356.1 hypothetical protein [Candidatus Moranbacteria bacterium]HSA08083.1 hypothetical protein [Candidatus Moranbacteria bacterium]
MKKIFQKFSKIQKVAIIIAIVLVVVFGFFEMTKSKENKIWTLNNALEKLEEIYKLERIKNLGVSKVDTDADANFILKHFKDFKSSDDLKNITREDLKKIKIREAKVADLPAIINIHNKGLKKGIWCDLPYKTSAWAAIKEYQELKKKYGKENIYIRVAEIDGKIVAVMSGAEYQGKAINLITFVNVDIPQKLWSETVIKIAVNFFELARSLNLDIVEARIAKGVWLEGFMRDVIKAESLPDGVWHIDRDYNLSRTWTEEDYNYDNDAVKIREEKNAKGENLNLNDQSVNEENGKIISRTEISDTFKKKDGSREMLIYPSPANIKIDGKWVKIDDYLKQPEEISEDKLESGKQYQMKPFDVYVGADADNKNIIKYNNDGNQISFSLESLAYKDQNKSFVLANAEVGNFEYSYKSGMFKDIFNSVDLKYHSTRNGIKEELFFNSPEILKSIADPDYFGGKIILKTKINVSDGIIPELQNNQIFFKKDGQNIFSTSQPYIYDQEKRTYQVESELKKEGGVYYLEIALDYGWMTSDEKAYPLVLDPDLNINPSADVCLCIDSTCSTTEADVNNNNIGRAFIKFDISSIPDGMTLQSASLILAHSTNNARAINARRFVDQTWTESSALATFTGGSFGSVLSTVTSGAGATETWNVLGSASDGLIKEYNDGSTYYSIYLDNGLTYTPAYVKNTTPLILYLFYNKDATPATVSDSYDSREGTTQPILKVTYIAPACGDGSCNGTETHATCPIDCSEASSSNNPNTTIFDYVSHPVGAKSILNTPSLGKVQFRKQ